jgi:hypothetical protein
MTPTQEDSMKLRQAAFCLETVAHLRGLEHELLPLADALREIAERTYPTRRLEGREGHFELPHNRCPDCGEEGERKGHMECRYPQD